MADNETFKEKPVRELLDGKHHFLIPSYQRGYRWDKKQVEDLLNDLAQFVQDDSPENNKYFLQPIVVKKNSGKWEVLDGQQRLTTTLLLLKYFFANCMIPIEQQELDGKFYTIEYVSRPTLNFDNPIAHENIDSFYLFTAKSVIGEWFRDKVAKRQGRLISRIKECLFDADGNLACFIWYEEPETSNDESSIKVFNRINKGKIGLTSSELIKALFVMSYGKSTDAIVEVQKEQFMMEWTEMERRFQNDKFWYFISNDEIPNRMDILFDFVVERKNQDDDYSYRMVQNLYNATNMGEISHENLETFWSLKKISNMDDAWKYAKKVFDRLVAWFEDDLYYHYVGFLINQGQTPIEVYSLLESQKSLILNWRSQNTKNALRLMIRDLFLEKGSGVRCKSNFIDNLDYEDDFKIIRKVLLLHNVETCLLSKNQRFDFEKYKTEKWDVEHINSQNSATLQTREERLTWIYNVLSCLEKERIVSNATVDENLIENCKSLISTAEINGTIETRAYANLYEKVGEHFVIADERNLSKHEICNLVLLNSSINREYKDAPFMFKRETIIKKDKLGNCFIPVCTKNCFLKYYTDSERSISQLDMMRWNKEDRNSYLKDIHRVLDPIFETENL